jgi:hypothetical protein
MKPEYIGQAAKLCQMGATDYEIADFFGVSVRTLHRWKHESEEFCHSIKSAKGPADDRVERSLYERATGFNYVEKQAIKVKVEKDKEKVVTVEVERFMPPDTTAAIFWLKNRRPTEFRDRHDLEHSGGVTVQIQRFGAPNEEPQ